ncbi:MAG TPA: L-threonylcarbamoyladenylate synthase [Patescibacteria group bacterium]|nr:L-threonylcarbamoyladenylate synthase [Patescibacteria group bacterium]
MEIVKANKQGVEVAVLILKQGGIIVYPTETAYGLGADFLNPQAVKKIYRIKGRAFNKPLSVLVSSLSMAKRLVKFDGLSQSLAKKHWPGPLTLVLEIKNQKNQESNKLKIKNLKLNKNLKLKIGNYQTLGLRISSNKLATAIVKKLGGPLTATSANLAGQKECYSAEAVVKQFKDRKHQPDLIIDAGRLPAHPVSTVTRVIDGQVKVLRKGKIYGPSASDKRVN